MHAGIRRIITIISIWTNRNTDSRWVGISDHVCRDTANIANAIKQVESNRTLQTIIWANANLTGKRTFSTHISRDIVKIQVGACQNASMIDVIPTIRNRTLPHTLVR